MFMRGKYILYLLLWSGFLFSSDSEKEKKAASLARYYLGIVSMHREWAIGIAFIGDVLYQKERDLPPEKQKSLRDGHEKTLKAWSTSVTQSVACLRAADHACERGHPVESEGYRRCLKEQLFPCVQEATRSFYLAYSKFKKEIDDSLKK